MISFTGLSLTHLSRVWNHASFSDEMAPVVCATWGIPRWELTYFAVVTEAYRFLFPVRVLEENLFTKNVIQSSKMHHI